MKKMMVNLIQRFFSKVGSGQIPPSCNSASWDTWYSRMS